MEFTIHYNLKKHVEYDLIDKVAISFGVYYNGFYNPEVEYFVIKDGYNPTVNSEMDYDTLRPLLMAIESTRDNCIASFKVTTDEEGYNRKSIMNDFIGFRDTYDLNFFELDKYAYAVASERDPC